MDKNISKIEQAVIKVKSQPPQTITNYHMSGPATYDYIYDYNFRREYSKNSRNDKYLHEYYRDVKLIEEVYRMESIQRVILTILAKRKASECIVLEAVDSLIDDVPKDNPEFVLYLRTILHEWENVLASLRYS